MMTRTALHSSVVLLALGLAGQSQALLPSADSRAAGAPCESRSDRLTLLAEGFEDFWSWPSEGWAILSGSENHPWRPTYFLAHSGRFSAQAGAIGDCDEWLVSPALDFSSLDAPFLSFFEDESGWTNYGEYHYIAVSTTTQHDPAAFTMIAEWTPANHEIPGFGHEPTKVDLSAFAGSETLYIAFRYLGNDGDLWYADLWYVDDVRVCNQEEHDIQVLSVTPDTEHFQGGASIEPRARVGNIGLFNESFAVSMVLRESGVEIYSELLSVSLLDPGSEQELVFPALSLGGGQYYELIATALLSTDEDPSNDAARGKIDTYTEAHVPIGLFFTNTGCPGCPNTGELLNEYTAAHGNDVALLRIHTWWPSLNDPMYLADAEQCSLLTTRYEVACVPDFVADGNFHAESAFYDCIDMLDAGLARKSPLDLDFIWNREAQRVTVSQDVVNPMDPLPDYRLFCAVTEDSIEYEGSNGEAIHHQVLRRMLPDLGGMGVSSSLGQHEYLLECPLDPEWIYDNLRATLFVQEGERGYVWQARTKFLREADPTGVDGIESPARLLAPNYPNPFNPTTVVTYSVPEAAKVDLAIFDISGRLVRRLIPGIPRAGGLYRAVWDGRDDSGVMMPSGIYIAWIRVGSALESRKMTLLR